MLTPGRIDTFLSIMTQQSPEDWESLRLPEGYWAVKFKKSYPPFLFFIEFNQDILYVQYIFRDVHVHYSSWQALYRTLLRLNEELTLVKFGLTARDNIALMGELPSDQFSLDAFQNMLRLMVQYLQDLYWEIGIVAETDSLATLLTAGEASRAFLDRTTRGLIKTIQTEKMTVKQ
jgi:hypothetical protein